MSGPRPISILGSTGSIGRATLSLARALPEKVKVVGLAAHSSVDVLARQILQFGPELVSVADPKRRDELLALLSDLSAKDRRNLGQAGDAAPKGAGPNGQAFKMPEILWGQAGIETVAAEGGAETVVSAVSGAAGLRPTWAALRAGTKVALANKESLVLGGEVLMNAGRQLLSPVDSEHSAIFQALGGTLEHPHLNRLVLTASGGPFFGWSREELASVTPEMALNHPTWSMGPKITCDSATMMNKGLEVIEARHLFNLSYDQIEVVVHRASLVHSLAGFVDGSLLAQLGPTDMRLAIAYALSHPERWPLLALGEKDSAKGESLGGQSEKTRPNPGEVEDFARYRPSRLPETLTFAQPDRKVFKALALAEAAGRVGGTATAILNGANEAAVEAFLAKELSFVGIADVVEETLEKNSAGRLLSIEDALAADAEARVVARELIRSRRN
ncbi:MAG: 1-deoxy-D-xylulose-5-phosphate reductoisomerase [Deltaproteobacteria bacterium]|jgi:1-deoxy-D-xylulose-5-phosphate reductoisomerase|nr:1-deoxy-D-xylulose-5-phosphate reductoisomerase [Deltaproteobacteria bacterium]